MTQQERENKIKELENQIAELKAAKVKNHNQKRWKPKYDEIYWLVDYNGNICNDTWYGEPVDEWCYLTGNCFKTKEEAAEYKKQIEYTARYKNHIEEHSEPLDLENTNQGKYFADFNCDSHEIEVSRYSHYKQQGTIYASSEQIIQDAIKEIGEDNFKKYVLGVK